MTPDSHDDVATAQDVLRSALRDVLAPAARLQGYKGSSPTWRKSNTSGDVAVVNVQSSSGSTSNELRCVVNVAVVPEPWLRWERERLGAGMPKSIGESFGLYRDRLHPSGTPAGADGWWEVGASAQAATEAVSDMVTQLELRGWDELDRMLTRDGMLAKVRAGDLGFARRQYFALLFARAEALLLMDDGPSEALDELLASALEGASPAQRESAMRFEDWVRRQAAAATQ